MSSIIPPKLNSITKAMGITEAIHSFERFNSASRTAMVASQKSQQTMPATPDYPRILTGYETQEAEYTLCDKMPADGTVRAVINKYTVGHGLNAIRKNSEKTIVFVNEDTGALDCVEIKSFDRPHDVFGFELKEENITRMLRPGIPIAKNTHFNKSNGILEGNVYSSILQANFCYLSHAPVIEDGMWVSESFAERSRPMAYADVDVKWGAKWYPLNMYGNAGNFKPHPGPGEKVHDNGLVCAVRKRDELFDLVGMLPSQLRKHNQFDQKTYVPPEAVDVSVEDVDVITTVFDNNRLASTPVGMEAYSHIFVKQKSRYYDRLLEVHDRYMEENRRNGEIAPRLSNLLVDAYADKPNDPRARFGREKKGSIQRTHRGTPKDEWSTKLKLSWRFKLGNGAKSSNLHGSFTFCLTF